MSSSNRQITKFSIHVFSKILIPCIEFFIDLHRCSWIFMDFGAWVLKDGKNGPAALVETFAQFQAGFLSSEGLYRIM